MMRRVAALCRGMMAPAHAAIPPAAVQSAVSPALALTGVGSLVDPGEIKTIRILGRTIYYLTKGMSGVRFETLLDKEPETIEWIDSFQAGETLWDVGANVGIYSIYAALRGIKVFAFEPNFANYFQLCIHVMLNGLQDSIMPLCLALADKKSVSTFNLSNVMFGGAMSTFGNDLDFRGKEYKPCFRQGMVGYDVDGLIRDFGLSAPDHFKIDVDGIELDIIKGGKETFGLDRVKSVSIELVDSDAAQVEGVSGVLAEAGLPFVHKKQNAAFSSDQTKDVLNFLYRRG